VGELRAKRALVTGASSGIGRATALRFAREGASLALVGRDSEALRQCADEAEAFGAKAAPVLADLIEPEACAGVVAAAVEVLGGLDILVNAAGIIGTGTVETTSPQEWDRMMRINLDAVFQMMQAATPHLRASRGNIVNISSVTGLRAFPGVLAYCVSKAAVDQLTRCVALELADAGVRVNAVNPGVVVSQLHRRGGMGEAAYEAFLEHSKSTHPLGRVGRPEDVAAAVAFLASDDSAWITGETLSVDGGRHQTCAR